MACLLHGSLAFTAILFVQHLQLAPQAEPFTWQVAMVTPSPIAAPSTPEASGSPARVKTVPAPTLQQSDPPTATAHPVADPSQPRVETPAIPPPAPVAPVVEKPVPPPPPIAKLAPTQPILSKPESDHQPAREQTSPPAPIAKTDQVIQQPDPVPSPTPPSVTSSQRAQTTTALQAVDTPMASPPHDPTPATPAVPSQTFEPLPQRTSTLLTELIPPVHDDSAATHSKTPVHQPPAPVTEPQVAALTPAGQPKPAKVDYGWLSELMAHWIEDLDKRYPAMLRSEGIQGKVTLMALLHEDGVVRDVRVGKSSGNTMLDQVAVEDVKKGPPIKLSRPLARPQIPVKFSIIYDLKTVQ